jgi:hypothetical protein
MAENYPVNQGLQEKNTFSVNIYHKSIDELPKKCKSTSSARNKAKALSN